MGDSSPEGCDTMRDCLNHRAGFDRVLMTVAATFLTVSATSALAQDQARSSAAELAIEAAIPRPEPANVPPPTAADIKLDSTATVQEPAKDAPLKAEAAPAPAPAAVDSKPTEIVTTPAPKAEPAKPETAAAPAAPAAPAAAAA